MAKYAESLHLPLSKLKILMGMRQIEVCILIFESKYNVISTLTSRVLYSVLVI